jgi:hypothetical protein
MAGSNPDFNAAEFRAGIHLAMEMGAALDADEQVTFHFPSTLVYNTPGDETDTPFDPTTTVTSTPVTPKRVPCAVEYFDAENQPTNFGLLAPSRLEITLLDEDYEQIKNASYVVVHGDRYNYRRTQPPQGLFDVGLYVMHFTAVNEARP